MKLSDYVVHFVADQGVRHVFLVTGGGAMHLNNSLADERRLVPVCNSHEQASAICAEGYAKATNHLGVCMVTTGPGGTNAVTGVAGAWLDSTPTLFISGQVKRPDRMFDKDGRPLGMRQLGVQEVDIVSIVKPITKYAVTVLDPNDIRYHMEKAVYLALHGRPGPVWIDIPLDVQASPIPDPSAMRAFDPAELETKSAGSNLPAEVGQLIAKLNQAERPLLFAGNAVRLAHAEKEFEQLRTMLKIPTVATWCAADLVPSDDPAFVGRPGTVAARGANFALQNCDLMLAIGVRLDFAITGYAPQNLAREAHKAAVDIDPAELQKLHPYLQRPICADARAFLVELLRQKGSIRTREPGAWNARCADWKMRYPVVTHEHRKPDSLVSIFNLAEVIGTESNPEDLLVSGSSGSGIEIFLLACPTRNGQRITILPVLGRWATACPCRWRSASAADMGERFWWTATAGFNSIFKNWRPPPGSTCPAARYTRPQPETRNSSYGRLRKAGQVRGISQKDSELNRSQIQTEGEFAQRHYRWVNLLQTKCSCARGSRIGR